MKGKEHKVKGASAKYLLNSDFYDELVFAEEKSTFYK